MIASELRSEFDLLLACARTTQHEATCVRVSELLKHDLDWSGVLRLAQRNGVAMLLYRNLSSHFADAVPHDILAEMHRFYEDNTRINLLLTSELFQILDLFEQHAIPVVPYKGPLLTSLVYRNLSLRLFSDLDIVVQLKDIARVKQLLRDIGYRQTWPTFQMTPVQETSYLLTQCNYQFTNAEREAVVEAHWAITPRFFSYSPDLSDLWQRLQIVSLGGRNVRSFPPEDMLLMLCVHGAKHQWERLIWICDVAELLRIQQTTLNWTTLTRHAACLGAERMLLLGLHLAHELLEAPLPKELLQRIEVDSAIKPLAAEVYQNLRQAETKAEEEDEALFHSFHVKVRERLRDKLLYCFRVIATPTTKDLGLVALPGFLSFVYFLLRPLRLSAKYRAEVFRRFRLSVGVLRPNLNRVAATGINSSDKQL